MLKEEIDRTRVRVAWLDARQEEVLLRALEEFSDYLIRRRRSEPAGHPTLAAATPVGRPL
jgi:hypothetical protein